MSTMSFEEYFRKLHRELLDFRRSVINGNVVIPDVNDQDNSNRTVRDRIFTLKEVKKEYADWETEFSKFKTNEHSRRPEFRNRK